MPGDLGGRRGVPGHTGGSLRSLLSGAVSRYPVSLPTTPPSAAANMSDSNSAENPASARPWILPELIPTPTPPAQEKSLPQELLPEQNLNSAAEGADDESSPGAIKANRLQRTHPSETQTPEDWDLDYDEDYYSEDDPQPTRWKLPIGLFFLTVASTVWVGVCGWSPLSVLEACLGEVSLMPLRQAILANWQAGLWYSLFLLGILMAHELGHYLVARWYRVPATPPIFLPFPINSIGTLGAVIAMRGHEADRKQIFDIGIAGPLAGLVLAFPVALLGTWQLDLDLPPGGGLGFEMPLAMRWMITMFHPEYNGQVIWLSQLNPAFTAAWVALLVTGLNMMPVSQLDGGHVTYGLFVRSAHWISCSLLILAIAYMVYQQIMIMALMVVLLLLMGPTHPPTRDDSVKLGWPRFALGLASLLIPILCFPPNVFKFNF